MVERFFEQRRLIKFLGKEYISFTLHPGEANELKRQNPRMKVLYICDGKACGYGLCPNGECEHTTDYEHALFKGLIQEFIEPEENQYWEVFMEKENKKYVL